MVGEGSAVAICQFGGEFVTNADGSMFYTGGEAHAIDVDRNVPFSDFKSEITSVFNIDVSTLSIKYFLPNNKKTLITISCDKDLHRMIDFYADSACVDVYILKKIENRETENVPADLGIPAAVTISISPKSGKQKRSAVNAPGGRKTRSRGRLANSDIPEVPGATIEETRQQRQSATGASQHRNVTTNNSIPDAANVTTNAGEQTLENQLATGDSSNPGADLIAIDGDFGYPSSITLPNDIITGVGQEFDNVKDFRDRLCEYAISKSFVYKFVKNESARVTVKCDAENCPWRLHASEAPRKKKFVIKKLIDVHTCGGGTASDTQPRVTKKWLVNIIKEKLRENPEYKPKDIADDIYRDFGISVSYFQVWHGKNDAEKELYKMHVEACNVLPWFCKNILESNPGSVVTLATSSDSRYRVFVSFHASIYGFEHGCRPLIFLDRVPLKKNNHVKLLAAAAVDGDDGIYPIAFAVVEAEAYDSWFWFLEQLKSAVTTSRTITFISNRQNGLEELVPQVFEDSYHSYSVVHLVEDFKAELNKGSWSHDVKQAVLNDLECAVEVCLKEDFDAHIESIRKVSKEAADWVMDTKPEHWSNALFKGSRYNHFSAEIVEFNDWIPVRKESSVVLMIDAICSKMIEVMHTRRESCNAWEGSPLTPSMEQRLQNQISKAHKFDVLCSSDTVFEVRGSTVNVVNTGIGDCTCGRWRITGLPCPHAIAVFNHTGKSAYDYCSEYFKVDCYRATYSELVHEIPDVQRISSIFGINLYPPSTRDHKWHRLKPNKQKADVRALHCSRCKGVGHNKATCDARI